MNNRGDGIEIEKTALFFEERKGRNWEIISMNGGNEHENESGPDTPDDSGTDLSRAWDYRDCAADPADRPVLYGSSVLLCKKLQKTT